MKSQQKAQELNSQNVDVVIVGGGLAGLSMASAMSSLPLNIVVIETAKSPLNASTDSQTSNELYSPSFDDRALALSLASIKILKNIGVFQQTDIDSCTPIEHIHVSDKGHIGMLRMAAKEVDEANLGRVIPAPLLGKKLSQFIADKSYEANITVLDESKVTEVIHQVDHASVHVSSAKEDRAINCQVVILADGGRSNIAEQVGLFATTTDYQQVGILANVVVDRAHQNIAYERFTDTGPLALLPLRHNEFKLVWTVKSGKQPEKETELLEMSDEPFLTALQQRFGHRAGTFEKVSRRVSYPMKANERRQIVAGRVALIGNAAHSLHPIAGQGFNLGLRDVACLAEILALQLQNQNDLGDAKALMEYQSLRQNDIQRTAMFTDQLVKSFSTSSRPIAALRTIGLLALDRQPMLKRQLMRKLMGLSGQQFKLLTNQKLLSDLENKGASLGEMV